MMIGVYCSYNLLLTFQAWIPAQTRLPTLYTITCSKGLCAEEWSGSSEHMEFVLSGEGVHDFFHWACRKERKVENRKGD